MTQPNVDAVNMTQERVDETEKREPVLMTEKRIHEIWAEQWAAHKGDWAEEFVYQLGKAYEREVMENNK